MTSIYGNYSYTSYVDAKKVGIFSKEYDDHERVFTTKLLLVLELSQTKKYFLLQITP